MRAVTDTATLEELRRSDYARLDAGDHVYLDYTGAGLYADSQLSEHLALLRSSIFGNPHSLNPTSAAMTALVEQARASVLEFFRASPAEYVAIFTPNATGALRLVGEAYPFRPDDRFLLTFDNHNSVNGIREFARARGAETTYVPSVAPELRVDEDLLPRYPDGRVVDERYVDRVARRHNISLRTGCFCNPGAGEVAFTISRETLVGGEFGEGMTLDDYIEAIGLPSGGAIRASLGLASNHADIERFTAFAGAFVDLVEVPDDLPPRIGC